MNRSYKVVFCKATGVFKAVSETAKSGKKTKATSVAIAVLAAGIALSSPAFADTVAGDPVVAGDAQGTNAIAVGETSTAIGENALAVGTNVVAIADDATAIGTDSSANGDDSVAIGKSNSANGAKSTAIGSLNVTEGYQTTAIGYDNSVVGMSGETTAVGSGNTVTNTSFAAVFGTNNTANVAYGSTAIGFNNDIEQVSNVTSLGQNNTIKAPMGWDERPAFGLEYSTAVGFGNNVAGSYSTVSGYENYTENGGTTVTGRDNYVVSENGGAYGGENSVIGGFNNTAPVPTFAMTRMDDGFSSISAASYSQYIPSGESYAYGNANFIEADQTHAIGNRNRSTSNMSGVFGNGNSVTSPSNNFGDGGVVVLPPIDGPLLLSEARTVSMSALAADDSGIIASDDSGTINLGDSEWVVNDLDVSPMPEYPILQRRESTGNFTIGNANNVVADNTHTLGNANEVNNSRNVTIGNSNKVSFYEEVDVPADDGGVIIVAQRSAFSDAFEQNKSTAIVGDTNTLTAAGGHILGTENRVSQENTYVVGARNSVLNDLTSDFFGFSPNGKSGSNITGSDNRTESSLATITGDMNQVSTNSQMTAITGYLNNSEGNFNSQVGHFNAIQKDGGGSFGTGNQVYGITGIQEAVRYAQMNNDGESEPTIDVDYDGIADFDNAEEANFYMLQSASYTHGNLNGIDGGSVHIVGNQNTVAGERSGAFGNNNKIGDSGKFVDRFGAPVGPIPDDEVITATAFRASADNNPYKYDDTFAYGNDNQVDAERTNVVGSGNLVLGQNSGVFGNDNDVNSDTAYVTGDGNDVIGTFNVVNGLGNDVDADDTSVFGNYNTVRDSHNTVIGNDGDINGRYNTAVGNLNSVSSDNSTVIGSENGIGGEYVFVGGDNNNVIGYKNGAVGSGNDVGYNTAVEQSYAIGNSSIVDSSDTFVIGNNTSTFEEAVGSVLLGSNTVSTVANGVAIGKNSEVTRENTVSFGNSGITRQLTNVSAGVELTDAVNVSQLKESLLNVVTSVDPSDANILVENVDGAVTVGLADNVTAVSLTTGDTVVNTDGVRAGAVFLSSTTGLDNAGNRVTSVGDAVEETDAVNLKQLNDSLRDTTGDENITATQTATGYNVSLNQDVNLGSVTTGDALLNTNGLTVGGVTVSTTGLDNAGNRVTSVGDAVAETDAVNLKQLNDSLRDTTGDENITATQTATGYNVSLNQDVNLASITTGDTLVNTDGVRAGAVFLSSTTGLNNAGNRVTGVADAVDQTDAVNLKQLGESIRDTSGSKNITATRVDTGYQVFLNEAVDLTSVTTGNTVVSTDGVQAGSVVLSSTTGLDNAGNRVTSVGDAVAETDAVNLKQLNDSLRDTTGDENITATQTATGYNVSLNQDVNLASVTTGDALLNTNGLTVGGVTVKATGLDNAGNRVTSVGDAVAETDAVNLKQLNASLRDTTGDENITATQTDTGFNVSLNQNVNLDSVTTGDTVVNTDGVRAGSVVLSSTTGLDNAGNRVTSVGNAIETTDAVNLGQVNEVDDRLTAENVVQNTNITNNTTAINKGFSVGNGETANKFDLGDTVSITADRNTKVTTTQQGVQVGLADDIFVSSVTSGSALFNDTGFRVGDVVLSRSSGLHNAGFTISGVGNAVNRDEAINKGQLDDALKDIVVEGVNIKGDSNITVEQTGNQVQLGLNKDVAVDSVTTGQSSLSNTGLTTGSVVVSSTAGLNNAGFTVSGVGNAVNADDAVNLGQMNEVDARLTAENAAQNIVIAGKVDISTFEADQARQDAVIATKADKDYVDAENNKQNIIIAGKADTSYVDAADQNLQVQIDEKVDKTVFEASQEKQNQALKEETDRLDEKDKDLQAQVNQKVEKEEFIADQKRQDDALKEESDVRDEKDKDLQAQVDQKVERDEFIADQKRQDDALKEKVDQAYVDSQNSATSQAYEQRLEQVTSVTNDNFEQMVAKQSIIDNAQDERISQNSQLISDLGYKVDNLEDKLSAGIASSIAFAAMPTAINKGEVRIAGGTGYFNGSSALAVGITGATETGDVTYKFGGSYTRDGGAVVGGGVSYRVW